MTAAIRVQFDENGVHTWRDTRRSGLYQVLNLVILCAMGMPSDEGNVRIMSVSARSLEHP